MRRLHCIFLKFCREQLIIKHFTQIVKSKKLDLNKDLRRNPSWRLTIESYDLGSTFWSISWSCDSVCGQTSTRKKAASVLKKCFSDETQKICVNFLYFACVKLIKYSPQCYYIVKSSPEQFDQLYPQTQGVKTCLSKFEFSANFPIGLHMILQIQIKKIKNALLYLMWKNILTKNPFRFNLEALLK